MTVLTDIQRQAKERSVKDVTDLLDRILDDSPTFTGKVEVNLKDGIVLDFWSHRRYSVFDGK